MTRKTRTTKRRTNGQAVLRTGALVLVAALLACGQAEILVAASGASAPLHDTTSEQSSQFAQVGVNARDNRNLHTSPPQHSRSPSSRPLPRLQAPSRGATQHRPQRRIVTPGASDRDTRRGSARPSRPDLPSIGSKREDLSDRLRKRRAIDRDRTYDRRRDSIRGSSRSRVVCIRGIERSGNCHCRGTDVPRRVGANTYTCITGPLPDPR